MKCPVCNIDMELREREGVEVDFCQECGGVFLDEDELDGIIQRSPRSDEGEDEMQEYDERDRLRSRRDKH